MKKYNFLLSVLLVPSMVLQAGNTCTTGGPGAAPVLPNSVTGVQTYNYTTPTLYDFTVNSVSSAGAFTAGTTYGAWCTYHFGVVPGGGTNPDGSVTPPSAEDPSNTTGVATYTPVYSYSITTGSTNNGEPGLTYDATLNGGSGGFTTTSLTLAQEWSAVNWILNNPNGVSGETPTTTDTQGAIWQLLHPDDGIGYVVLTGFSGTSLLTGSSWLLYKDALANGLSFVPSVGQVVGILMVPTTPSGSPAYQGFLIPVPIACSATGSATLTKSANVTSANAYELVTYTYTIKNTGSTTLQNIVIVDDNGTPNYTEDDVTITLPAGTTLAPGASYSVTSTVYLPISLFYQSGNQSAFDTLIPQILPVPAGSPSGTMPQLMLTYLIDTDVTDNTYGTGASAGWAGNGGHTFAEVTAGYAEFGFYDSEGHLVSDFNSNYLKSVANNSAFPESVYPSGYATTLGTVNAPYGPTKYIDYLTSTLADNLNGYSQFKDDTTNSPVAGTPNWQTTAGYKVVVSQGIFGMYGMGSGIVRKNYLAATETGYSGKCGSTQSATYWPTFVCSTVNSTAYLCAQVCGCSTYVHAKACLSVKLNGNAQPTCNNPNGHQCQNPVHCGCNCAECQAGHHNLCTASVKCKPPVCSCTCVHCKAGDHANCSKVGCTDPTCHANNCNHNTIQCVVASVHKTICW